MPEVGNRHGEQVLSEMASGLGNTTNNTCDNSEDVSYGPQQSAWGNTLISSFKVKRLSMMNHC